MRSMQIFGGYFVNICRFSEVTHHYFVLILNNSLSNRRTNALSSDMPKCSCKVVICHLSLRISYFAILTVKFSIYYLNIKYYIYYLDKHFS